MQVGPSLLCNPGAAASTRPQGGGERGEGGGERGKGGGGRGRGDTWDGGGEREHRKCGAVQAVNLVPE